MVMKKLEGDMRFASGYAGEDSMRAKAHKLLADEFANTPMTKPASMTTPSREKMRLYKKGGPVKGTEKHMSHGGRADDDNEAGGHLTNLHLPKHMRLNVENFREADGMRKGGRAEKKHVKRARGGSVYEHDMLGEHPSRKTPHINYESEMMGETPERKAQGGKLIRRPSNAMDASHGQYKKKGGSVKMAAGGVAKERRGVADKNGKPINRKTPMGY
jgi:hypothetical protein